MTSNENSILLGIANDVGEIKTDVAVVKTDFSYMKEKVDRNTDQISEIRCRGVFTIDKIWPFIVGLVVSAAAFGAIFSEKLMGQ